jgi:hypothetical protein
VENWLALQVAVRQHELERLFREAEEKGEGVITVQAPDAFIVFGSTRIFTSAHRMLPMEPMYYIGLDVHKQKISYLIRLWRKHQ